MRTDPTGRTDTTGRTDPTESTDPTRATERTGSTDKTTVTEQLRTEREAIIAASVVGTVLGALVIFTIIVIIVLVVVLIIHRRRSFSVKAGENEKTNQLFVNVEDVDGMGNIKTPKEVKSFQKMFEKYVIQDLFNLAQTLILYFCHLFSEEKIEQKKRRQTWMM